MGRTWWPSWIVVPVRGALLLDLYGSKSGALPFF